jgi:predicted TPR repeat methyltransferase
MNLGNMLVKYYMYDKAVVCYRNVLIIDPDDVSAYEGLGDSFKELNKLDESESYYKKACDLGSVMARHFLAAVKNVNTEIAPREYVTELFDAYAKDFEDHLKETLSYRTPELQYEAFAKVFNEKKRIRRAIDLGCGTGLAAVAFAPVASCIDGVDLSSSMLEQAEKKKIYSELHNADIVEYLEGCGIKYDLFIATDVFVYIGNLSPVFTAIRDAAARGAYLVFSVESTEEDGFVLQRNGRYAHSDGYIRKLARENGFDVVEMESAQLRKEEEAWVQGRIVILKYSHRA